MIGPGDKSIQHPAGRSAALPCRGKGQALDLCCLFYAVPDEEKNELCVESLDTLAAETQRKF